MYYSVTGWIKVSDSSGGEPAVREAIASAAKADSDPEGAARVAEAWTFTGESYGSSGCLALWSGNVRHQGLRCLQAQVEAVAKAIPGGGIGDQGWALQGLFHIMPPWDESEPREWRLHGPYLHECERKVPPYDFTPVPPRE